MHPLLFLSLAAAAPTQDSAPLFTSFEDCAAGPVARLVSAVGVWTARAGHAAINDEHAATGGQCLHLLGGDGSEIELELAAPLPAAELTFRAERWTRAAPFAFDVEARVGRAWEVVFDGAEAVTIGHFATRVRVALPAGVTALRLGCASPPGKGVLIDDLALEPLGPMELVSCTAVQPVLPVLIGNRINPVLRIDIETTGALEPLVVTEVRVDLEGTTDLADVGHVELFHGGDRRLLDHRSPRDVFGAEDRFGAALRARTSVLTFESRRVLRPGLNTFWVSVAPRAEADLDGFVDAGALRIGFEDGAAVEPAVPRPPGRQRLGVAVRSAGDDGAGVYRIPGLATTNAGTLLAVYDIRWAGWVDLPGDVDVGMSRSTDGGRTWEPMRVILDMGDDPDWRHDGVGDPAVLVDRATGAVHVVAAWSHGDRAWRGSGPGLAPEETGQLVLVTSADDGATWSAPRNLTAMVKRPEWSYLLQGPGRGITMGDGRLVFPAQFQLAPEERRLPHSTILWSDDHGATWHIGTGARPDTTESAVVELGDGELMLNMRDNRGGSRAVYVTEDLGRTWAAHPTSRGALPEPVCMASLIHVGRELTGEADGRLVFSNPAVAAAPRREMTLQGSADSGAMWTTRVLLDEGHSAGYSCLTMVDEETVGVLYEGSRAHMTFQRVKLAELFPAGRQR